MDPNACLARFWKAYHNNDFDEAYWAAEDLKQWLARGGFAPKWSAFKGGKRLFNFVVTAYVQPLRSHESELPARREHEPEIDDDA